MPIEFIVIGEIPSLKNVLRVGRAGQFYHADNAVKIYKANFNLQLPREYRNMKITEPVRVELVIYQKDKRKDPTNACCTIYDCLQHSQVIINDRQIVEWSGRAELDRKSSRVEVKVIPL